MAAAGSLTRFPWLVAAILAGGYLLLVAAVYLFQARLLYLPASASLAATEEAAGRLGLRLWPGTGDYYGLAGPAPTIHRGTVLLWHGNAGTAADRFFYVEPLGRLGYQVLLLEYPGYGARPGAPSERALVADGVRVARAAMRDFRGPFYAWGESLGGGVAAGVAAELDAELAGVVMLTPWRTLPELAQHLYRYLPARWLVRDRYDNPARLRRYPGPVAVVLAERDEIIPPRHTLSLYQELPGPKKLIVLPGAGHNSWPTNPAAPWWREAMAFVAGKG